VLVHLVEPLPMDGTDPIENYRGIRAELTQYDVHLGERPEILAVTKAELPNAASIRDELAGQVSQPVLLISAVTGQGLNELTRAVAELLQQQAAS